MTDNEHPNIEKVVDDIRWRAFAEVADQILDRMMLAVENNQPRVAHDILDRLIVHCHPDEETTNAN